MALIAALAVHPRNIAGEALGQDGSSMKLVVPRMTKSYLPYDPDQQLLLPAALHEWLPEDYLAYIISDVVETGEGTAQAS